MIPLSDQHKSELVRLAGKGGIVAQENLGPLLGEWRGRTKGQAPLALSPDSAQTLSRIMAYCYAHDIPIVPQGGNTGLVGGQIPHGEVLITLSRMRAVKEVSPENSSMTLEAGVTLQEAQAAAEKNGMLFPLSIGSEGSCQMGGVISTNAGGVNVLRYGNMRDLTLGLEVVLPDGTIWQGLNRLRKNNTGYDLKHLFIGAEGTLGIITTAIVKLFPQPAEKITAFAALPSVEAAVDLLALAQSRSGGQVTSFELISEATQNLVIKNIPNVTKPLAGDAPWLVLLEVSAGKKNILGDVVEQFLGEALKKNLILDATIAQNNQQQKKLWRLRHEISPSMRPEGPAFKGDIAVPINHVADFLREANRAVKKIMPEARIIAFGHLGDGNIHYDVLRPDGSAEDRLKSHIPAISQAVLDCAYAYGGTFSAEHGVGDFKKSELAKRKDETSLALMRQIKAMLDPKGLMNPGKLL